ncbi:MAG: hypothetical protein H6993_03165 [Pseudomonadales bacterium]|nr:hypothetical protein [Pseudomonadales bacterium]MCP5182932.1 hypothetical protein [Pseudomonadales bacterium]
MTPPPACTALLETIALGETRAAGVLDAWASSTRNAALRETLALVARRARTQSAVMAQRLHELGGACRADASALFEADLAFAASGADDADKFSRLFDFEHPASDDARSTFFDDTSIDPLTGELLGRYIAESRDSERRLRACQEAICRPPEDNEEASLASLVDRLDRLNETLRELKSLRSGE